MARLLLPVDHVVFMRGLTLTDFILIIVFFLLILALGDDLGYFSGSDWHLPWD